MTRRGFLGLAAAAPFARAGRRGLAIAAPRATDVRIAEVRHAYEDWVYRAPYKFGGRIVDIGA